MQIPSELPLIICVLTVVAFVPYLVYRHQRWVAIDERNLERKLRMDDAVKITRAIVIFLGVGLLFSIFAPVIMESMIAFARYLFAD